MKKRRSALLAAVIMLLAAAAGCAEISDLPGGTSAPTDDVTI